MGGFSSITDAISGNLPLIRQGVGLVTNLVSSQVGVHEAQKEQELALRNLQQQQRLNQKQLAQQNALEREQIAEQARTDEENRRSALRRAVARQRAQFGSSGLGNVGNGSQEAVLLGLFDETEEELAQRERLDNLRNRALDLGASQQRSLNILQLEQLRQQQNLGRLSSIVDQTSDFIDFGLGAADLISQWQRS